MPETTKPVTGDTSYITQHQQLARGDSLEGAPSFGCGKCCTPVKGKRAPEAPMQKLPGFSGPMNPPYRG
jgi:hypothetical protein